MSNDNLWLCLFIQVYRFLQFFITELLIRPPVASFDAQVLVDRVRAAHKKHLQAFNVAEISKIGGIVLAHRSIVVVARDETKICWKSTQMVAGMKSESTISNLDYKVVRR